MTKGKLLVSFQPTLEPRLFPFSSLKSQMVAQWNLTWTLGPDWEHTGGNSLSPHTSPTNHTFLTLISHLLHLHFKTFQCIKNVLCGLFVAQGGIFIKQQKTSGTCFCNTVQRADSRLVASWTEVQADGEALASPHDQTIHAVQVRTVLCVVGVALQVPTVDVQSFEKKDEKRETLTSVDAEQAQS